MMKRLSAWAKRELYREDDPDRDAEIMHALGGVAFTVIIITSFLSWNSFRESWFFLSVFAGFMLICLIHLVEILRDDTKHIASRLFGGIFLVYWGCASLFFFFFGEDWDWTDLEPMHLFLLAVRVVMIGVGIMSIRATIRAMAKSNRSRRI